MSVGPGLYLLQVSATDVEKEWELCPDLNLFAHARFSD
jgi:hypothetical protein